MEAAGKSRKMSGNDSAISERESREERFEEFALNKKGLTSRREPLISPRLAVLLQPVFPAVRSRAVSRTGPRPLRRGLSRLRHQGVHCARFHRGTCRRCRTSMDPSSVRTKLWFRFQPAPMVVPTLGTFQLHPPCRVLLRVVPELTTYPCFLQALGFFVQPIANSLLIQRHKNFNRAGSVQRVSALSIELLSSPITQCLDIHRAMRDSLAAMSLRMLPARPLASSRLE